MSSAGEGPAKSAGRPLEAPPPTGDARLDALARLLAIVDRLRAPDGCPWDREQTVDSLAPSLIEEAHECVEAVERRDERGTVEEAGDLLMVLTLIARVASEEQRFDFGAVARMVGDKLVRRHPHVFGDVVVDGSAAAIANWEKIKQSERATKGEDASALAGVPSSLPALQRALRIGAKARTAGFRWTDAAGALAKLREELDELAAELERAPGADQALRRERIEAELGDVLLSGAFLGCYLDVDPERAARAALRRFEARFREMERDLGPSLRLLSPDALAAAWRAAKARLEG